MGILNRLFGDPPTNQPPPPASGDEEALRRYRYLLRTAPPEAIEQAHTEAFAQLTPEQRTRALTELARAVPERERPASAEADPQNMARMATRAELRQPGTLERIFGGGGGGGASLGGVIGGSLLGSIAGSFIGTAIAHELLGGYDAFGGGEQQQGALTDESAPYESDTDDEARYDDDVDPGGDVGGDDFGGDGFDV